MNSYNKPRSMSNKGMRKQAMPAPKLMAIENEFHRTKDALVQEIRRLRGEVGVLAKRNNNAKREIEELVRRVRSQPPPLIPKRDEKTERRNEERRKRWREHLQREMDEEKEAKEKAKEKEEDDTMQDLEPSMEKEQVDNILSPELSPLDQSPQLQDNISKDIITPDIPDQTPLEDGSNDVEMTVVEEENKEEEEKEKVKEVEVVVGEKWMKKRRRMVKAKRESEYIERAERWELVMEGMGRENEVIDLRWLKEEPENIMKEWKLWREMKKWKPGELNEELELEYAILFAWSQNKEWDVELRTGSFVFRDIKA